MRGYDDKGCTICTFCYPLASNGFDFDKRRHEWFCGRACQFEKDRACHPVCDVAVGLPTGKHPYHRTRNASESRNATFERWDLKSLLVDGEPYGEVS